MRLPLMLAVAILVSGCNSLAGFSDALVPQLVPIDARLHSDRTCGDLATAALAAMSGNAGAAGVSPQAVLAIVKECEARDDSTTIRVDPQGARKAFHNAVAKPLPVPIPGV